MIRPEGIAVTSHGINSEPTTMSENEHRLPSENPYASPASTPMDSQSVPAEADDEQYLRVFVGSKADYDVEKWTPLLKSSGHGAGFNWAAFFLSSFWLPYRKMYVITTILYAIILLNTIVERMLFVESGVMVGVLAGVICGRCADRGPDSPGLDAPDAADTLAGTAGGGRSQSDPATRGVQQSPAATAEFGGSAGAEHRRRARRASERSRLLRDSDAAQYSR